MPRERCATAEGDAARRPKPTGRVVLDITEIRVKLVENRRERLLAFCTVTFHHEFVIRDVKIIDGARGPFVAMPSRKVMDRCQGCGSKNHLRAAYCNDCGIELDPDRAPADSRGRPRLHVDVAHPINQQCRSSLEERIVAAYRAEQESARQPGYVAPDLEDNMDDYVMEVDGLGERGAPPERQTGRRVREPGADDGHAGVALAAE
jgi:stage V sporulation protein G